MAAYQRRTGEPDERKCQHILANARDLLGEAYAAYQAGLADPTDTERVRLFYVTFGDVAERSGYTSDEIEYCMVNHLGDRYLDLAPKDGHALVVLGEDRVSDQ